MPKLLVTIASCCALLVSNQAPATQRLLARKPPSLNYSTLSSAQLATLGSRGFKLLEDYGPFLLLEAPDNADLASATAASGVWITTDALNRRLHLSDFEVDTGTGQISGTLDPDLQIADYDGAVGLYLVQFYGPLKSDWLKPLAGAGARTLGFIESNGFIVAAPRGLDALKSKLLAGPIQYVGVLQPAFKLPPSVRQVVASDVSVRLMTALLDGGQDLTTTYAQLRAIDVGFSIQGDVASGKRVSFLANASQARALARLGTVLWVEVIPDGRASDEHAAELALGIQGQGTHYVDWLASHYLGNLGGQIVHVLDSGVQLSPDGNGVGGCIRGNDDNYPGPYTGHIDLNNESNRFRLFIACPGPGGPWTADGYYHGTLVASTIAGNPEQPGGGQFVSSLPTDSGGYYWSTGLAPTASILTTKYISNGGILYQPPSYTAWASYATTFGATKQNDSWNLLDTSYSSYSAEYDGIVRNTGSGPLEVVFSSGNSASFVSSPANAKNVIAVGASGPTLTDPRIPSQPPSTCLSQTLGVNDLANYSSRRFSGNVSYVKPDLVAPGLVTGARSSNMDGSHSDCSQSASAIDPDGYYYVGRGTSYSAPQVTGASVLVDTVLRNGYPFFPNNFGGFTPAPSLIKAVLVGSAASMYGGWDFVANRQIGWEPGPQGWGRLSLARFFDGTYKTVGNEDRNVRLFTSTGQSFTFTLTVQDSSKPVILVLAWTDPPASPGASNPIVNKLALYAWQGSNIYCDGYYGGQYTAPTTACYLPPDTSNNVKVIRIAPGMSGQFSLQAYGWALSSAQDWSVYVYNAHI